MGFLPPPHADTCNWVAMSRLFIVEAHTLLELLLLSTGAGGISAGEWGSGDDAAQPPKTGDPGGLFYAAPHEWGPGGLFNAAPQAWRPGVVQCSPP